MTQRTRYEVICPCGHRGTIVMAENDASFSKQYESYSLEHLDGSPFYIDGSADWQKVFTEMRPKCPKCQTELTPDNLAK